MSKLDLALANLRAFRKDRLQFSTTDHPKEFEGQNKLTKAMAFIREAQADFALADLAQKEEESA